MRAVRLHGVGDLRVEAIDDPGLPPPGWVRLDVTAAGICGSDLHNFRTGAWISRAPSTPGHELTGVVAAVGHAVAGFSPGDAVVADSRVWCGTCPACRAGRQQLCESLGFVGEVIDGGFAETVLLPARLLHPVSPELPSAVAAMAEPFAVGLHAVRRLAPPEGAPVLVVGCGPIGGMATLILARRGHPVLVTDRNAERAGLAARVTGATVVPLDAAALAEAAGGPVVHMVEATGSVGALEALVGLAPSGSRLALVGIYHGPMALDPSRLVEREIALVGCHAFSDEFADAVAALPAHQDALAAFVDREIGLDEVPDAYRRLIAGEATGLKTIVRPRGGAPA